MGEVITRDFGRLLEAEDRRGLDAGAAAARPRRLRYWRLLAGVSQSAWFVNSFIAEGFTADPATGKAVPAGLPWPSTCAGGWMTINQLAARHGYPQYPYLNEAAEVLLLPTQLLTCPASDPIYVDAANYNDFYRVRASVS